MPGKRDVLEEAWECVEKGFMTEGNFCDFVWKNPIKLLTNMNPDFFKSTVLEKEVAAELAALLSQIRKSPRRLIPAGFRKIPG